MKPSSLRPGDKVQREDFREPLQFVKREHRSRINIFIAPWLQNDTDKGIVTMKDSEVIRFCKSAS